MKKEFTKVEKYGFKKEQKVPNIKIFGYAVFYKAVQYKSRRTRNRSSGFFYFTKPLRNDCNQLRFDCSPSAFVRRTLFTSGANHASRLQCIVTVQNNLFHNTIVPKIKGKNYYIETKKTVARETNFLCDRLIKFIKKHSQTVKGSTMFPEWWHGRKHRRTTIVPSSYFSINRTLCQWQFYTSNIRLQLVFQCGNRYNKNPVWAHICRVG